MRRSWLLVAAALAGPGVAPAQAGGPAPTPAYKVLESARTPEEMRSRLADLMRELLPGDRASAGEAALYVGALWREEGRTDSARAWFERAVALRGQGLERLALADVGLDARDSAGAHLAMEALAASARLSMLGSGVQTWQFDVRRGWAHHLLGRSDSALALMRPAVRHMREADEWMVRLAEAELAAGNLRETLELLLGIADHEPIVDPRASRLLEDAAQAAGLGGALDSQLSTRMDALLRVEDGVLDSWGAGPAEWRGVDGMKVRGVFLPSATPRTRRAGVLVLRDFDTPLAEYDSLALAFSRRGYPVLLAELRGTEHTRDTVWHSPHAWRGRERLARALVVEDVRRGLTALAAQPGVDTSAMVVVGLRESGPMAAEAASRDPRVRGLVLVTPRPELTQIGPLRASVERLRCPAYFQTSPEELDYEDVVDSLYRATDPMKSRLVDCRTSGSGTALFRRDERVRKQLVEWVGETLPARRRTSASGSAKKSP
jgi:dienelactone hydrolase